MTTPHLCGYLEDSARRWPGRTAVVDPSGSTLTYAELDRRASALAGSLHAQGVAPGDRVGVVLPKTADAIVSAFGIMKAGAAYVPVDYTAPAERSRGILIDCQVRAVIADARCLAIVPPREQLAAVIVSGAADRAPGAAGGGASPEATAFAEAIASPPLGSPVPRHSDDLAYILYTSGSTGIPKGVMLTHGNATSFVDWCSSVFSPDEDDRFSSHAPLHFDLSVLDVYLSLKHGASLHLISEELGKNPTALAAFIAAARLTVWYSTPSILTLIKEFGRLDEHDDSSLRLVLFAGEVFPVKHLRDLQRRWPRPVYYNLYGPTETNVCTFARIPAAVPDDRDIPYPIGLPCAHCTPLVLDETGTEVREGDEGLLYMRGPSVFQGYWNRPAENAAAFLTRDGVRWYNTGDVVRWEAADGFIYAGRRDRMIKRRGYRIELGEIERALSQHEQVREAAVVAVADGDGLRIVAYVTCRGAGPSIVAFKTFCASALPAYMSPDRFVVLDQLPHTSTDKIDYQTLKRSATS